MWPYPWTNVGTASHPGHRDWVAATLPSQAPFGAAQGTPELGQWEGQDVPLVGTFLLHCQRWHLELPKIRTYLPFVREHVFVFQYKCLVDSRPGDPNFR